MYSTTISDINYFIDRIIYHSKLSQYNKDKPEYNDSIILQKKQKYHTAKIYNYKYKINKLLNQL